MPERDRNGRSAEWLRPRVEQQGLQRYVNTIRERIRLILAITLLTTGAAVAYVLTAPKEYTAEADVLVTPISGDDPATQGLGLISRSSDPTRDVETAARLIVNREVALRVKKDLKIDESAIKLEGRVSAEPVAQSNLVAVTATGDTAKEARNIANGFAKAVIDVQTDELHRSVQRSITALEPRVKALTEADQIAQAGPDSLPAQLARLQALLTQDDPTMRLQTRAALPTGPSSPKKKLSIVAGLLAGLILGIGSAFALQVLDPRLRREEQLRTLYGLPILGRIPRESSKRSQRALAPERLSPPTLESYRTLRATLAASRRASTATGAPAVLVTSASPSEGKSTTAINLASSLALAGNSVILIEADLRRPSIGDALGVVATHGTGSVLMDMVDLQDALVETKAYGRYLRLLLADKSGAASGVLADQLFLPAAANLVTEAKQLADYVVIDSPPLSEVIDALPLAQQADEVLVVVRLGRTQLTKLQNLGELLARHDIEPVGFAVVGVPDSGEGYYYTPTATPTERTRGRTRAAQSA